MKKVCCFILTILSLVEICVCQEIESNKRVNVGEITYAYYLKGIFFGPLNRTSNKPDSIRCDSHELEFYLNDLKICEVQYYKLNLSHRDLSNYNATIFNKRRSQMGKGTYEYHFQEGKSCFNKITYKVEVKLAIFLNGKIVNLENQADILKEIISADIVAIKRKQFLLKRGEIHIITR